MTFDAVLVARRGLGPHELRLIDPAFLSAVRWAVFAERASDGLAELRSAAAADPPRELTGQPLTEFLASRRRMRDELAIRERALYPSDSSSSGSTSATAAPPDSGDGRRGTPALDKSSRSGPPPNDGQSPRSGRGAGGAA